MRHVFYRAECDYCGVTAKILSATATPRFWLEWEDKIFCCARCREDYEIFCMDTLEEDV